MGNQQMLVIPKKRFRSDLETPAMVQGSVEFENELKKHEIALIGDRKRPLKPYTYAVRLVPSSLGTITRADIAKGIIRLRLDFFKKTIGLPKERILRTLLWPVIENLYQRIQKEDLQLLREEIDKKYREYVSLDYYPTTEAESKRQDWMATKDMVQSEEF